ncbi:hypothetical protein SLEP1_g20751 [Rubroshorea leprosula]|uniref:Uncharacterized protein n=1 Tax=Rubroshorea leprosula TaxID=152421 RepID=A0AAV5JCG1_9ROSI|nr:hypothetical protein SLEP1_g20751 [Rubroshorea leprosula]
MSFDKSTLAKTKDSETLYRRFLPLIASVKALLWRRALRDLCILHQSRVQTTAPHNAAE